jgi:hypothetical protein
MKKPFPVTDDHLDAPDGEQIDGFERHGSSWQPIHDDPNAFEKKE